PADPRRPPGPPLPVSWLPPLAAEIQSALNPISRGNSLSERFSVQTPASWDAVCAEANEGSSTQAAAAVTKHTIAIDRAMALRSTLTRPTVVNHGESVPLRVD